MKLTDAARTLVAEVNETVDAVADRAIPLREADVARMVAELSLAVELLSKELDELVVSTRQRRQRERIMRVELQALGQAVAAAERAFEARWGKKAPA